MALSPAMEPNPVNVNTTLSGHGPEELREALGRLLDLVDVEERRHRGDVDWTISFVAGPVLHTAAEEPS